MIRAVNNRFSSTDAAFFLIANILVLAIVAFAYVLESGYPDFYYLSIQEDEVLEWSSFWSFLLAAVMCLRRAADYRLTARRFPWYLLGLALFCFIVAMEEISWGQRVLGYRPPAYFLAHNFQQEFNFHNIVESDLRKLALTLVIGGYGIVLPLAARFSLLKTWLDRIGVLTSTSALLPAFVATLMLYILYPWSHSGEWVELMLGVGILFSIVHMPRNFGDGTPAEQNARYGSSKITLIASIAVISLGLMSAALSRAQRNVNPANLEAAKIEVEAIADRTSTQRRHRRS